MEADTYFFSLEKALEIALQHNRSDDVNKYLLQVCYYNGEKIDSELDNLVHLPIENLVNDLATGIKRIPTNIDFSGLDISVEVKQEIETNLLASFEQAQSLRNKLNSAYIQGNAIAVQDFSQQLRFYLRTNGRTRVMQYVSRDIADEIKKMGYDVYLDVLDGTEDTKCMKNIFEYNPHVTININHFHNVFISPSVFNFIWFQDPVPITNNEDPIFKRERDYIFTYQTITRENLLLKGVSASKIFDQKIIPTNTNIFYLDKNIKRENKIVFVGTYYKNIYQHYVDEKIESKIDLMLKEGKSLSIKNLETIFTVFLTSLPDANRFINYMQQTYIRNICVEWLCENEKKVEVYGYNWENHPNQKVVDNFKGELGKEELNKVYNSAKYVFSASGQVINTQRLGEIVHAGAIPVIYDSRDISDEDETWDDECLYFKTQDELNYILDNNIEPKKYRTKKMLEHFTYNKFLNTIFEEIDKGLNG